MKILRLLGRKLWRALFFLNGSLTFIILFPLFYILLLRESWFPLVFRLKKIWAHLIIFNVGIRYRIIRENKNPWPQPCIICPNHTSFLDIVMTYIVIPEYYHFMGKAELKKVPLFNKFFDRMNILVDRKSIVGAHKAFKRAASDLDKSISIAIFPEATIPDSAPRLGRLKNGAFKLAIEKQVPIVPVVYLDNWKILPDGPLKKTGGTPGISRVVIPDPIPTTGMVEEDADRLKLEYQKVMLDILHRYGCYTEADQLKPVSKGQAMIES
jgi:1-acyl-sn-glycerol-3-phosphate acyltransferase